LHELGLDALTVLVAPSLAMIFGSFFALTLRVPDKLQAMTQNFSAGLLISAVAGELYPLMSPPTLSTVDTSVAITIGFIVGLAFMLGLDRLAEDHEDHEADDEAPVREPSLSVRMLEPSEEARVTGAFRKRASRLQGEVRRLRACIDAGERDDIDTIVHAISNHVHQADRQLTMTGPLNQRDINRMKFHCDELSAQSEDLLSMTTVAEQRKALKAFGATLDHIHQHAERTRFQRWKPEPMPEEGSHSKDSAISYALVGSVVADGGVDGLLVGLAYAAAPRAGAAMSIATCIEMGFLGLSFCASIMNATNSSLRRAVLVLLPPLALTVAGLIGAEIGEELDARPFVFVSFIGFSVVCLLFLVTQELLAEAREVAGEDAVITAMLFVGLLSGILLSTFLD